MMGEEVQCAMYMEAETKVKPDEDMIPLTVPGEADLEDVPDVCTIKVEPDDISIDQSDEDSREISPVDELLNNSLTPMDWLPRLNAKADLINCEEDLPEEEKKPPYSYASLIRLAILNSPFQKATLADIYRWIQDKFVYYRQQTNSGWKNSIRHNLSLNKCFMKVARARDDPGKGCYWAINHRHDSAKMVGEKKKKNYFFTKDSQGVPVDLLPPQATQPDLTRVYPEQPVDQVSQDQLRQLQVQLSMNQLGLQQQVAPTQDQIKQWHMWLLDHITNQGLLPQSTKAVSQSTSSLIPNCASMTQSMAPQVPSISKQAPPSVMPDLIPYTSSMDMKDSWASTTLPHDFDLDQSLSSYLEKDRKYSTGSLSTYLDQDTMPSQNEISIDIAEFPNTDITDLTMKASSMFDPTMKGAPMLDAMMKSAPMMDSTIKDCSMMNMTMKGSLISMMDPTARSAQVMDPIMKSSPVSLTDSSLPWIVKPESSSFDCVNPVEVHSECMNPSDVHSIVPVSLSQYLEQGKTKMEADIVPVSLSQYLEQGKTRMEADSTTVTPLPKLPSLWSNMLMGRERVVPQQVAEEEEDDLDIDYDSLL